MAAVAYAKSINFETVVGQAHKIEIAPHMRIEQIIQVVHQRFSECTAFAKKLIFKDHEGSALAFYTIKDGNKYIPENIYHQINSCSVVVFKKQENESFYTIL